MKVKISNYTTWYGPYQIAGILLFWMDKEDDRVHNFGKWLSKTWLNEFCEWVHSKKKRKIDVEHGSYSGAHHPSDAEENQGTEAG
jgi:hypothetical protein